MASRTRPMRPARLRSVVIGTVVVSLAAGMLGALGLRPRLAEAAQPTVVSSPQDLTSLTGTTASPLFVAVDGNTAIPLKDTPDLKGATVTCTDPNVSVDVHYSGMSGAWSLQVESTPGASPAALVHWKTADGKRGWFIIAKPGTSWDVNQGTQVAPDGTLHVVITSVNPGGGYGQGFRFSVPNWQAPAAAAAPTAPAPTPAPAQPGPAAPAGGGSGPVAGSPPFSCTVVPTPTVRQLSPDEWKEIEQILCGTRQPSDAATQPGPNSVTFGDPVKLAVLLDQVNKRFDVLVRSCADPAAPKDMGFIVNFSTLRPLTVSAPVQTRPTVPTDALLLIDEAPVSAGIGVSTSVVPLSERDRRALLEASAQKIWNIIQTDGLDCKGRPAVSPSSAGLPQLEIAFGALPPTAGGPVLMLGDPRLFALPGTLGGSANTTATGVQVIPAGAVMTWDQIWLATWGKLPPSSTAPAQPAPKTPAAPKPPAKPSSDPDRGGE